MARKNAKMVDMVDEYGRLAAQAKEVSAKRDKIKAALLERVRIPEDKDSVIIEGNEYTMTASKVRTYEYDTEKVFKALTRAKFFASVKVVVKELKKHLPGDRIQTLIAKVNESVRLGIRAKAK